MGVEALAMRLWREREMQFPPFARRMKPDDIDHATGAWAAMLARAKGINLSSSDFRSLAPK